jgi:hypothetical protein
MPPYPSSKEVGPQIAAREHDATCATLVMRMREGKHSSDVFKCRFVMATRNPTFVKHARGYCLQSHMINQTQEGPVIHQRELATTAWLRTGLKRYPSDLNRWDSQEIKDGRVFVH